MYVHCGCRTGCYMRWDQCRIKLSKRNKVGGGFLPLGVWRVFCGHCRGTCHRCCRGICRESCRMTYRSTRYRCCHGTCHGYCRRPFGGTCRGTCGGCCRRSYGGSCANISTVIVDAGLVSGLVLVLPLCFVAGRCVALVVGRAVARVVALAASLTAEFCRGNCRGSSHVSCPRMCRGMSWGAMDVPSAIYAGTTVERSAADCIPEVMPRNAVGTAAGAVTRKCVKLCIRVPVPPRV